MKRSRTVGTVLLLVLGLIGVGETPAAAPKGKVVVALGADPPTMDPHMHVTRMGIVVDWHLFDDLLGRDLTTMKAVPRLAESIKPVDDLTWELTLRRSVKFHNGEPFTAESVKFSLERIVNPEQKSPIRSNFTWLKRVDVVDDYPQASQAPQGGQADLRGCRRGREQGRRDQNQVPRAVRRVAAFPGKASR